MFSSVLPRPENAEYNTSLRQRFKSLKNEIKQKQPAQVAGPIERMHLTRRNDAPEGTVTELLLNPDGSINYSSTLASQYSSSTREVQASYEDSVPLKLKFPHLKHHFPRYDLESCPDESLKNCVEDTRSAITKILNSKLGVKDNKDDRNNKVSYIKYSTNDILHDNESDTSREKLVEVRNYQEDPMLPPKFKLRKNRHRPPSPPPPILKQNESETKLTKEEREKWKIPSAVSNWKNNQGFTISLDKRFSATGSGLGPDEAKLNVQKFGDLSQALESADNQAREEIKIRNEMRRDLALKEQREKEIKMKELAELTRSERYGKRKETSNDHAVKRLKN
ncbi:uncharacterized protein PRCAT00000173001 [Priceomyces carsonii]|uniref:uncharacterized protein n=1 Tax=Priceomyces carsonii TaxID=28549 RepID=UPI002ED9BD24|nr:unnamed protein product [Priceomyces carsonii]